MPEQDGPVWPSGDSDAQPEEQATDSHALPKLEPHEQPTVWVRRAEPEQPGAGSVGWFAASVQPGSAGAEPNPADAPQASGSPATSEGDRGAAAAVTPERADDAGAEVPPGTPEPVAPASDRTQGSAEVGQDQAEQDEAFAERGDTAQADTGSDDSQAVTESVAGDAGDSAQLSAPAETRAVEPAKSSAGTEREAVTEPDAVREPAAPGAAGESGSQAESATEQTPSEPDPEHTASTERADAGSDAGSDDDDKSSGAAAAAGAAGAVAAAGAAAYSARKSTAPSDDWPTQDDAAHPDTTQPVDTRSEGADSGDAAAPGETGQRWPEEATSELPARRKQAATGQAQQQVPSEQPGGPQQQPRPESRTPYEHPTSQLPVYGGPRDAAQPGRTSPGTQGAQGTQPNQAVPGADTGQGNLAPWAKGAPTPAAGHAMPQRIEPNGGHRPAAEQPGRQRGAQPYGRPPNPQQSQQSQSQQSQAQQQQREQRQREQWQTGKAAPVPANDHEERSERAAQPAEDEATAKPGKRRRTGLLVGGALGLVVLIAAGIVLALPSVANRLALPWAPNAPKGDPPDPAPVSLSLHGPRSSSPTPTPNGVSGALNGPVGNPALGTLTGSVIDPATGQPLWDRDSGTARTPASTTKLLTAAAALLAVDHGTQLSTKVVAGPDGTATIVAGGDVTLSSLPQGKESIYPGAAHLDDLVAQVKASGVNVTSVRLDGSAFSGPATAPGWAPEDAPSTFAAPVGPAMLDGGRTGATNEKSVRTGDPGGTLTQQFAQRLGVSVASGGSAPADGRVLGEVRSAPITELVDQALRTSDNLLADVLARQTAIATGNQPSFEGAAKATLKVLRDNGFDVNGVQLSDGSGLSTQNKVPANVLSKLLSVAAAPDGQDPRSAKLRPLVGGLPVAGGSGTLAGRYTEAPADEGKGWVRAKTGTLDGVNTLAGIVLDADGRPLVFALMSDGPDLNTARPALDAVAAALRGCGCR